MILIIEGDQKITANKTLISSREFANENNTQNTSQATQKARQNKTSINTNNNINQRKINNNKGTNNAIYIAMGKNTNLTFCNQFYL